jgi:hypothetical protein
MRKVEALLHLYLVTKAPSLPTDVKEFIVKFAGFITLFNRWSSNLPDYIYYGPFGQFVFFYEVAGFVVYCALFRNYSDCSFSTYRSPIPYEYSGFLDVLVNVVLLFVVTVMLLALPELFKRRKRDGI